MPGGGSGLWANAGRVNAVLKTAVKVARSRACLSMVVLLRCRWGIGPQL